MISGNDAAHDLRLFVEDVSDSLDLRLEEITEPVHTVEELSRMFNVSTKTISRWRDQGLVSRRFVCDGRKRVGFLHSSVERFVSKNMRRVKRGERFSQLSDDERAEIIERARTWRSMVPTCRKSLVAWPPRYIAALKRFANAQEPRSPSSQPGSLS